MREKIKRDKRFFIPLLAETYVVTIAWGDEHDIRRSLIACNFPEDTDLSDWNRSKMGLTFSCENTHPLIAFHRPPKTSEEIGTLSHEAVHAVRAFFRHINTPVTDDTEELFAQFVGAIVRQTLAAFRALNRK